MDTGRQRANGMTIIMRQELRYREINPLSLLPPNTRKLLLPKWK